MSDARFVHEVPLADPSATVERALLARLETARLVYNRCITELLRRDALMRESVVYRRLRGERAAARRASSANPKMLVFKDAQERAKAWRELRAGYDLAGKYCLAEFVADLARELKPRMGARNELQVTLLHELARRAWEAYEPYLLGKRSGSGRRGRPRRRRYDEPFTSLSTRSSEKNAGQLRFLSVAVREAGVVDVRHVLVFRGARKALNGDVTLRALVEPGDVVAQHALALAAAPTFGDADDASEPQVVPVELAHDVCQVRIGYRVMRGRRRWFAQLVLAGEAFRKPRPAQAPGSVGIDVGARHIAVVAPAVEYAALEQLNPRVAQSLRLQAAIERQRARAQDRSRRATNPEAFDKRGRYVRGKKIRVRSKRYRELGVERREAQRVANETKRQQTNALANRLVALGTTFHLENLAYRAWQAAGIGKSMLASTPGAFERALRIGAAKYGREFVSIDARVAKLSQRCPSCAALTKHAIRGPIGQRMSTCACGRVPVQRDILAAFLAAHCGASGTLDAAALETAWPRLSSVLAAAASSEHQPTSPALAPARSRQRARASETVAAVRRPTAGAGACEVRSSDVSEAVRDHRHHRIEQSGDDDVTLSRSQAQKRHGSPTSGASTGSAA